MVERTALRGKVTEFRARDPTGSGQWSTEEPCGGLPSALEAELDRELVHPDLDSAGGVSDGVES